MPNENNLIQIKVARNKKFSVLSLLCVENKELSWKAKGLHTYLITRPDNWNIYMNDLIGRSIDGQASLQSGMRELLEKKYLARIVKRNEKKSIAKWGYLVAEEPVDDWISFMKQLGDDFIGWGLAPKSIEFDPPLKPNNSFQGGIINIKDNKNQISSEEDIKDLKVFNPSSGRYKAASHNADPPPPLNSPRIKLNRRPKQPDYSLMKKRNDNPTPKEPIKISKQNEQLIQLWNSLGLHSINPTWNGKSTKCYENTIHDLKQLRRGLFFNDKPKFQDYAGRPFTVEEISTAFTTLHRATLPDYQPSNPDIKRYLKRINLSDFLYNPRSGKSIFISYLGKVVEPAGNSIKLKDDKFPELTTILKKYYKKVVGGVEVPFSNLEENKFRQGAEMANDFYTRNKSKFAPGVTLKNVASYAGKALLDAYDDNTRKIEVGNFCSARTWNKLVPAYMADQMMLPGDLLAGGGPSIYDR